MQDVLVDVAYSTDGIWEKQKNKLTEKFNDSERTGEEDGGGGAESVTLKNEGSEGHVHDRKEKSKMKNQAKEKKSALNLFVKSKTLHDPFSSFSDNQTEASPPDRILITVI